MINIDSMGQLVCFRSFESHHDAYILNVFSLTKGNFSKVNFIDWLKNESGHFTLQSNYLSLFWQAEPRLIDMIGLTAADCPWIATSSLII